MNQSRDQIVLSIIMATYNSEHTIEKSLKSIRCQSISQDSIEILVVDGFSNDRTREIAQKYKAFIMDNPERLPEPAKRIGIQNARGKYVLIMDSDEVLPYKSMLERRVAFIKKYKELLCLVGGYTVPSNLPACGHYISNIGDPFSAFVYDWFIGGNIGLIIKHNIITDEYGYMGCFTDRDTLPIGDSVTMMDREFIIEHYGDIIKSENTATIFHRLLQDTHYVGHVKGDYVLHYSKSDIKTYFKKLKFRVINNVFDVKGSGFSARQGMQSHKSYRKYLYPLYCLSFIMPIFDGIRMSVYYKHLVYLLHPVFAFYVFFEILIQYSRKLLGKKVVNSQYG